MIKVTLKDGSLMELEDGSRVIDAAMKISEGLARASVAGEINGEITELTAALHDGDTLNILTFNTVEGKKIFRHTTSHILAQAVKRLYPDTKLAIGPAIEDGFYYDFDSETAFTADVLGKIEEEMKKIVSLMCNEFTKRLKIQMNIDLKLRE